MKLSLFAALGLGVAVAPSIALAQAAPAANVAESLATGTMVYDPQGGEVGTIDSVSADAIVLDTGTSKATLPRSAFGTSPKGPTVSATKAQIDAAVANAMAEANQALEAALVAGAEVRGQAGAVVGTVGEVSGDNVILERPEGAVSLPKSMFAANNGKPVLKMTAGELEAAASAASAGGAGES